MARTAEYKALEEAEKRARVEVVVNTADTLGWRFIDSSKECFVPEECEPSKEFLTLKCRAEGISLIDIFRKFITDDIIQDIIAVYPEKLIVGKQVSSGIPKAMNIKVSYIWQALRVQVRIIGKLQKLTLNSPQKSS